MTATKQLPRRAGASPPPAPTPDPIADLKRISEIPGAQLALEECRWASDQQAGNVHFLCLLGELCGRCEPSGAEGYALRGTPRTWLRLRDVDERDVRKVLGRIERAHTWHLDAGRAKATLDRIDVHFMTAQLRRRQELAA
jgi:hypothetical protein